MEMSSMADLNLRLVCDRIVRVHKMMFYLNILLLAVFVMLVIIYKVKQCS